MPAKCKVFVFGIVLNNIVSSQTNLSIDPGRMVANGAPPRGSAAAAASLRRRRPGGSGATAGAGVNTMLQFYTEDATGWKMTPNSVLIMSIGFIAFVAVLHVVGKLYFVSRA